MVFVCMVFVFIFIDAYLQTCTEMVSYYVQEAWKKEKNINFRWHSGHTVGSKYGLFSVNLSQYRADKIGHKMTVG